jgi:hypothetical protein
MQERENQGSAFGISRVFSIIAGQMNKLFGEDPFVGRGQVCLILAGFILKVLDI